MGSPTSDDFAMVTVETPALREEEVLVRNLVMSVDPYMRGRRKDGKSYVPPFAVGKPHDGAAIGEVVGISARRPSPSAPWSAAPWAGAIMPWPRPRSSMRWIAASVPHRSISAPSA